MPLVAPSGAPPLPATQTTVYDPDTKIYTNSHSVALPPIPQKSAYQLLTDDIAWDNGTVAFEEMWGKGRKISLGELKLLAQRLGVGLVTRAKLKPGDVVMLLSPNSIDFVVVLLAVQFAGLRLALANPGYSSRELAHVHDLTQPKRVFCPLRFCISTIRAKIPFNKLITMDGTTGRAGSGTMGLSELLVPVEEAKRAKPFVPKDLNETAYLPCSSGTTGLPKAVEITHRNVCAMLHIHNSGREEWAELKRGIGLLPFFHAYALVLGVHQTIYKQGSLFIVQGFVLDQFLRIIEEKQIDSLTLVPPLVVLFNTLPQVNRDMFRSVKMASCGAAPLDVESQRRFVEKTGVELRQGWGMTETTVAGLGLVDNATPGSVGLPLLGVEVRIVDPETLKDVARGERGELWLRGPQVMKGYYRAPQATRETLTPEGWLRTGDVVLANDEGHFFVVDRIKELIKVKGFQVAPAEVEALILTHPSVAAAAVIGVYDASRATEWPRAYIELKPSVAGAEAERVSREVASLVEAKASHHKHLKGGVRVLPKVPVSASGKILRKELRAMAQRDAKL